MTAHDWYRPPIPDPPTICYACGVNVLNMDAPVECPGEPPYTEQPYSDGPGAAESARMAWYEHKETHR